MSTLRERVLSTLEAKRVKLLNGGINSIPSPFKRFQNDFLGVEQAKYYVVTASTKGAKTQFASYMFVYNTLLYAFHHPEQLRVKIFYYPLEETPEDIMIRFMSYLLYTLSNYTIEISPTDLRSTRNNKVLSQDILDLLNSDKYKEIIEFFENHIIFSTSTNPTGVWNECKRYAEENGVVTTKKCKIKDELGVLQEVDGFDYYTPNDPDEYRIVLVDHVSLISTEKGKTLKQSIDKLSEYCVLLRNRYGFSPVIIQQQAFAGESLDAFKENKVRPTIANLSDSKYPSRDCNMCLGLFSPMKHELKDYLGYNIEILRDNIRFLEVLINRGGSMGGIIALYFRGACCYFAELPPADSTEIQRVYQSLQDKKGKTFFIKSTNNNKSLHRFHIKGIFASLFKK